MKPATRFYSKVSIEPQEQSGSYAILLDGKPIKTPAGAPFILPNEALAGATAEEWRLQTEKLRPDTMPLTKLANTAIDRVAPNRQQIIEQILAFGRTDLVCYRAESPQDLVERQFASWDPLLHWARENYGAALNVAAGIGFIEQPVKAIDALARAIADRDDFALTALHAAATLCGSAVVALALAEGQLDAQRAVAAAQLDENYQAEKWGRDHEAESRALRKAAELLDIARFLQLLRI